MISDKNSSTKGIIISLLFFDTIKTGCDVWSLTFINERRWDLRFNQGLIIRLPEVGASDAWKMIVKLEKNYKILNLRLTEIDLRNSSQILAKINLKKDLILKRNNL